MRVGWNVRLTGGSEQLTTSSGWYWMRLHHHSSIHQRCSWYLSNAWLLKQLGRLRVRGFHRSQTQCHLQKLLGIWQVHSFIPQCSSALLPSSSGWHSIIPTSRSHGCFISMCEHLGINHSGSTSIKPWIRMTQSLWLNNALHFCVCFLFATYWVPTFSFYEESENIFGKWGQYGWFSQIERTVGGLIL